MCISAQTLNEFAAGQTSIEGFGPQTAYPFIAFELSALLPQTALWIKEQPIPCPIIGIGNAQKHKDFVQICDVVIDRKTQLPRLAGHIKNAPLAAMVLVQHLRASADLSLTDALTAESLAYAALQNGPEFQNWIAKARPKPLPISEAEPLKITRDKNKLNLSFNQPKRRNAIDVKMRDALCEALDMALIDTTIETITLTGDGATFSTGGDLSIFGNVADPTTAHWIRSLRLPATRLAKLTDKLNIHVNGAAIGAGLEITAFGGRVTASPKAWFQLPELKYGLIPGAGGTASLPRRIGRHRTAYMALSMKKINAKTALDWGLIDQIIDED